MLWDFIQTFDNDLCFDKEQQEVFTLFKPEFDPFVGFVTWFSSDEPSNDIDIKEPQDNRGDLHRY